MNINDTMVFIYELPTKMSNGYCFGGGVPITFANVDWFNGFDGMKRSDIEAHCATKRYVKPGHTYLVCSPQNDISFTFVGDGCRNPDLLPSKGEKP